MQTKLLCCLGVLALVLLLSAAFRPPRASLFLYNEGDPKLTAAIKTADSIAALPAFWALIRAYPEQRVDNSDFTMRQLADTLEHFSGGPILVTYIGWLHTSNAKTGYPRRGPLRIGVTYWGYSQQRKDLAITLLHEWVHAVDYSLHTTESTKLKFAHFCDTQDKCLNKATASYRVERLVKVMLGGNDFAGGCGGPELRPEADIPEACKTKKGPA